MSEPKQDAELVAACVQFMGTDRWPTEWAAFVASRIAQARLEFEREFGRLASIEEKAHLQTIDERDQAEETLSQAYYLITGNSPQWSNNFGHEQALVDIDDAQRCLRAEIRSADAMAAQAKLETAEKIISHAPGRLPQVVQDYIAELRQLAEHAAKETG